MSISDSKPRQTRKAPAELPKRAVSAAPRRALARYDEDFAGWAFEQAKLLREGASMQMLKWDHQPQRRSRGWATTIRIQRIDADRQIKENPSWKPRRDEALADAYETARSTAAEETKLPIRTFPPTCPYTWADVTERPFAIDPDDA